MVTSSSSVLDEAPCRLLGGLRNGEHAVAIADLDRYGGANFLGEARGKSGKIVAWRRGTQRQLHMGAVAGPIDGKACTVRAAVAHGCEHARQHGAELWLERLVL